jgi:hypothetical protein
VIYSPKERRYRCKRCGQTFSATKGTRLNRAHKPHELVVTIATLLAYGCARLRPSSQPSLWTSVPSLAGNAREDGSALAGSREHIIQAGGVLLGHVQAYESCAFASSAAWCAKQALKVFSEPIRTGKRGRPRLLLPEGLMVAQAVKRYARRRVVGVLRRVVRGTELRWQSDSEPRKAAPRRSSTPPTSSGCRPPCAPGLSRWCAKRARRRVRGRRWRRVCGLVGTVYTFCRAHRSLRLVESRVAERRWIELLLKPQGSPITAGRFTNC